MSYSIDLSGRVAFVTGASSGLGAQFARTLSKAGAAVVLAARRMDRLKTMRAELEAAGGDAHVVTLDVTDHASIKAAVAHAETEMGAIDILVNNSGVGSTQRLVDATPEDFDYVLNFAVVKSGDFDYDLAANAEGVGNLMLRCQRAKAAVSVLAQSNSAKRGFRL
mgnify:CR=1 FL=1